MTISHCDATSAAEAAEWAPNSTNDRTRGSLVSQIVKSYPAWINRRARRPPIRPTPIKPMLCSAIPVLLEHFSRDPEAIDGRRHAAIDRDLQEHFLDFIF